MKTDSLRLYGVDVHSDEGQGTCTLTINFATGAAEGPTFQSVAVTLPLEFDPATVGRCLERVAAGLKGDADIPWFDELCVPMPCNVKEVDHLSFGRERVVDGIVEVFTPVDEEDLDELFPDLATPPAEPPPPPSLLQ